MLCHPTVAKSRSHRRRIGQDAAWTPALPTTSGGVSPKHWYRSDSGVWQDAGVTPAGDGDVVGQWDDITANVDHISQATAGNKPTRQNGVLNTYPAIRYDGTDDYLAGFFTNGGALSDPFTLIVVAQLDATAVNDNNNRSLTDGFGATRMLIRQRGTTIPDAWGIFAGANLNGGDSDSNWNIWHVLWNGAASQFWLSGVAESAVGNAGASNATGITVGTNQAAADPWKGDVAEILIYDPNLSSADMNQVGQYLGTRYALSWTDL